MCVNTMNSKIIEVQPKRSADPQLIVKGYLEQTAGGSEIIRFNIKLAFFKLFVVVTVPQEGTDSAPVYVRFQLTNDTNNY